MRRGRNKCFQVTLLLGVGLAAPALAADPPDDGDARPGLNFHWASWMQDSNRPAPKKRTPPPKSREPAAPKPAVVPRTSAADRASAEREREVRDFLRRVAVCDKLHWVAQETHDEALDRQADQLERRAWAIYNQRTARLAGHGADPAADERTLDRRLGGTEADGNRLYTATGSDRGSQAAFGGEGKR